jgi:ribosomal-protein-alanine N-acetyltransferase
VSLQPIRLGPWDANDCRDLDQLTFGGLWGLDQWERELEHPSGIVLGLRHGQKLLGLACGQTIVDEFHVTAVAVHPDWRRRGLALTLLRSLLAGARQGGCLRATLEVDQINGPAVALYGRIGFETAGLRRAYYRSGGDALIQWYTL